ncbi:inorganic diphosphatase, partial [Candidatus Saccharibacteria bacterium]|nr:inorganic diphosphatase [Candidatus Saccharibacteria bacterium]
LEDLPAQTLKQIEYHFNHYKDLKKAGTTEVKAFEGLESAKKVIKDSIERYAEKHPEIRIKENVKEAVGDAKSVISDKINEAKKMIKEAGKK